MKLLGRALGSPIEHAGLAENAANTEKSGAALMLNRGRPISGLESVSDQDDESARRRFDLSHRTREPGQWRLHRESSSA